MKLVIGNKKYSSWSLRPWILLKHYKIPFDEILVKLDQPNTTAEILKYSKAGRVPALIDGDLVIAESLAIMEYLNELYPEKQMYPKDLKRRAKARAMANEMHAGFANLRQHLPFHAIKRVTDHDFGPAKADIARIQELWSEALSQSGGPFLLGDFSIVDAMFAPVVGRFETYSVPTSGPVQRYCQTMRALPAMQEWYEGAYAEDFVAPRYE